jgi:hypothetical protein
VTAAVPSSAVLAPKPGPAGSAAVIGGGWVLMADPVIELAAHIVQKAEQVAAMTSTPRSEAGINLDTESRLRARLLCLAIRFRLRVLLIRVIIQSIRFRHLLASPKHIGLQSE